MTENPSIFLSYARKDQERVEEYYNYLRKEGFFPWMDKYQIKGGQNWDFETRKALKTSEIVVVFLSKNSVDHRGYIQREIKIALKQYESKLFDDIYIIPIALDADVEIPDQLEDIHVIMATEVDGFSELKDSIVTQFKMIDVVHETRLEQADVTWKIESLKEAWEGLPGYDFSAEIVRFGSNQYTDLAKITDVLRGWATQQLLEVRQVKFSQLPMIFNFGQTKYNRQDSWEAYCGQPILVNKVLSLIYSVSSYGAGAAHPNYWFHAFNFIADPLLQIGGLESIFDDVKNPEALAKIQECVRTQVMSEKERNDLVDQDWLLSGIKDWDCFHSYAFTGDGLTILIPPYQIAPYAAGSFHILIDYREIRALIKPEYIDALGIKYLETSSLASGRAGNSDENHPQVDKPNHASHLAKHAPHLILPYEDGGEV